MDAAVADVRLEQSNAEVRCRVMVGAPSQQARADERAINKTYVEALNAARTRETLCALKLTISAVPDGL